MKYHKNGSSPDPDRNPNTIFVFGSNLAGRHGAGAALAARIIFKAEMFVAEGRTGQAYAIPTKSFDIKSTLSLATIGASVTTFIEYAREHPELEFFVTAIGTELAGYYHHNIAPLFRTAPSNCSFAEEWKPHLERKLELVVNNKEVPAS